MAQTTAPPTPLMLTISGLRGIIGQSLDPAVAARYAAALGQWFKTHRRPGRHSGPPHVVIGRDSRPSGQMIEMAATAGLVAAGCRVTQLGIATTPGTAVMIDHLSADGGLVITASHNPIIWNGIKALRHDGVAPPPEQARQIVETYHNDDALEYASVDDLQPVETFDDVTRVHVQRVLEHVDVAQIRAVGLKAVVDSVHGAGGPEAAYLLDQLGVQVVHLYGEPTGRFPHTPEPTRENLTELCEAVQREGADLGFAQDPDADRLAIVDEQGRYIGEEYTLALACLHMMERTGDKSPRIAAANLSTSRMIDDIAQARGGRVIRTPVGEANVAKVLQDQGGLIGGEGNGGVILPSVCLVRDSLVGMVLALELLATRNAPLSAVVDEIPRYAIVKDKVPVDPTLLARLASILQERFSEQLIDLQDGVRIDWPDKWVHVRPSNTEPIMRLIAEAPDEAQARAVLAEVRATLGLEA